MNFQSQLQIASEAAKAGGKTLMNYFGGAQRIEHKSSYNLVSEADLESEKTVASRIQQAFPDHEILGEESNSADLDSEHLWIIDPLDGTNNFVHAVPHFAVCVAYYHQGKPAAGVVYQPVLDIEYSAVAGGHATINGSPANVCTEATVSESLIGVGFYYDRGEQMRMTLKAIEGLFDRDIHGIRRMGTASLDLCMVGSGLFGAYFEFELAPWDYAAGRLFVEQAGGKVTDCSGNNLPIGNTSVLATNGELHGEMLEIIKPCFEQCCQAKNKSEGS